MNLSHLLAHQEEVKKGQWLIHNQSKFFCAHLQKFRAKAILQQISPCSDLFQDVRLHFQLADLQYHQVN